MDPIINMQKVQAIKKSRSNKKKQFHCLLDRLFVYFLALISCLLFFLSIFWLPGFFYWVQSVFFFHILKMSTFVLNLKVLFILTNVIVIVLICEPKSSGPKTASPTNDSYYDEYVSRSRACDIRSNYEPEKEETKFGRVLEEINEKKDAKTEKRRNENFNEGDELGSLPTEELNKRADNLIARVNRQRKLEARLFSGYIKN